MPAQMITYLNTQVSGTTLDELKDKAKAEIVRFFGPEIATQVQFYWTVSSITMAPNTDPNGDAITYVAAVSATADIGG